MAGFDFVDLISSVKLNMVESKKVHPRKPVVTENLFTRISTKKDAAAIRSLDCPNIDLLFQRKNGIFYNIFS